MRIILVLCVLCSLSWDVAAATLPACTPSRACALDRAKRLVLQQLAADPSSGRSVPSVQQDAVKLLTALMLGDPREYRSGFTRTVLDRIAPSAQDQLLEDLARTLIQRQYDVVALQPLVDIEEVSDRDSLYEDMALSHARRRRFELAYWAATRMRGGTDRDQLLLTIADGQLQTGLALSASQTAATLMDRTREQPALRESVSRIQAEAAAQLGDTRRALELAAQIATLEPFTMALRSIAEQQIERNARTDALTTVRFHRDQLRRRGTSRSAEFEIAERLSLLGAAPEALGMVQGSELEQAQLLAAIARGAARDARFSEALATLEKIPTGQRAAVRGIAAFVAQQRALHGIDFATAFDAASAFSPMSGQERFGWVRSTVLLLVRIENLQRARDGLNYAVEIAVQEPECGAAVDCAPTSGPREPANPCDFASRDAALCNAALLQARLGFIDDADRTTLLLRSEHAQITALLAVAAGQITASRTVLVRQTFARALRLAQLEPNRGYLDPALKAYAGWVATAQKQHDALPELYSAARELIRLDSNAACKPEGAPLVVATTHASAGQFATAFAMVETQLQCLQLEAYLSFYERGQR
jgi:hypothetical protein